MMRNGKEVKGKNEDNDCKPLKIKFYTLKKRQLNDSMCKIEQKER